FESEVAGARPGNRIAVRIGNGHDGVVERGANMGYAAFNIFPVATFRTDGFFRFGHLRVASFLTSSCWPRYGAVLCAYGHLFLCAVRERAVRGDGECRDSCRSPSAA